LGAGWIEFHERVDHLAIMPVESKKPDPPTSAFWAAVGEHFRNPLLLATYAVRFCVFFSLISTFTFINFYLSSPPFLLPT
jgi:hypothetical protein